MGGRSSGWRGFVAAVATTAIASVALASCELPASCTAIWDGPVGGDYATAANWDTDAVPTATDHVCAEEGSNVRITSAVTVGEAVLYGTVSVAAGGSLTVTGRLITSTLIARGGLQGTGAIVAARADIRNATIGGSSDLTVVGPVTSVDGVTIAGSRRLVLNALGWKGTVHLCDTSNLSLRGASWTSGPVTVTSAGCSGPSTPSFLVEPGATFELGATLTTSIPLQNKGTLIGTGTLAGALVNAGTIDPGSSILPATVGRLQIDGAYTAEPGETLVIEIAGPTPASGHDQVTFGADTDLGTTALTVSLAGGYVAPDSAAFAAATVTAGHSFGPGLPHPFTHPVGGTPKWSRSIIGDTLTVATAPCPTGVAFAGLDLRDADLSGCWLWGADFRGADLTRADLTNAMVPEADFTGATLDGTILAGAQTGGGPFVRGIRSSGIVGVPASLPNGFAFTKGFLVGPGAELAGVDLSGATITNADLTSTDLTGANLNGVVSSGITFTPVTCPTMSCYDSRPRFSAGTRVSGGRIVGPGVNLSGADLTGADLTDADLSRANLAGVILTNANLTAVRSGATTGVPAALPPGWALRSGFLLGPTANLRSINLAGINLNGVSLAGANLVSVRSGAITGTPTALPAGWQLVGGYLIGPGANLVNAKLGGLALATTTLTGVQSGGVTGVPASLPPGWQLVAGYLIGPGANLASINVNGLDLSTADLRGVVSGGITGVPAALPPGWHLIGGYLVGPGANLAGANLAGRDLSGLDLTDARLTTANLSGTNLAGATLTGVRSSGFTGTPAALPAGWHVVVAGSPALQHLIGPGANLAGADLRGADLSGFDLTGTHFLNANLMNVRGVAVTGAPASLPGGWTIRGGLLIGPSARLTGVAFGAIDLRNLDLSAATLSGSTFTGTDLGGANLTSAKLDGTTLTSVTLTGTRLASANLSQITSSGLIGTPASLPAYVGIRKGYLIADAANLTGADLTDADLRGLTLNLAVLDGATLTRVRPGWSGEPASLPAGWYYVSGYIVGPTVILDGESVYSIDLPGANLAGLSIVDGYFNDSDLSGANLTGADLAGAQGNFSSFVGTDFTGADLTGLQLLFSDLTGSTGPGNGTGALAAFGAGTRCADGALYGSPGVTTCAGRGPGW
jgi:uncharacterized protein YjbI with pentapeptide repeats